MKLKQLKKGDTFKHKGKTITIGETIVNDLPLSDEVYQPIEAYSEKWKQYHKPNQVWFHWNTGDSYPVFDRAEPVPGTRKRNDLPPLYIQWKNDVSQNFSKKGRRSRN